MRKELSDLLQCSGSLSCWSLEVRKFPSLLIFVDPSVPGVLGLIIYIGTQWPQFMCFGCFVCIVNVKKTRERAYSTRNPKSLAKTYTAYRGRANRRRNSPNTPVRTSQTDTAYTHAHICMGYSNSSSCTCGHYCPPDLLFLVRPHLPSICNG